MEDQKVLASAMEGGVDVDSMADTDTDTDVGGEMDDEMNQGDPEDANDSSLGKSYSVVGDDGQALVGYDASSPASYRLSTGMREWATPPSRTPSWTA